MNVFLEYGVDFAGLATGTKLIKQLRDLEAVCGAARGDTTPAGLIINQFTNLLSVLPLHHCLLIALDQLTKASLPIRNGLAVRRPVVV